MKHLTPEDKQHVLRRHQEGASLREIGREIGRPDITVRRTLEGAGIAFGPPRTTNKRSSPEAEAHVLRLYDEGKTWAEINKQVGVTSVTLGKILKRAGREYNRKSDAEANAGVIATLYEAGHSTRDIGAALGHGKSTVNRVIARHGGELRQMTGTERPDFFDVIDTPEKAYWLGFLAADGCIVATPEHPEGNHLTVRLAARDRGHLEKLKAVLEASASVTGGISNGFGKPMEYASLTVGSRRLTEALIALGIQPRKSATVEPWDGPADLMRHYWLGLFDGDGSIARKGEGLWTMFLCGSEACVRGFTVWAHGICGTSATPYFNTGCWYVSISGRHQVAKLTRAMYGDATVSLDRKQERADLIMEAAG
jgi:transposase-like protein